jgi:dCMP deaminase
MLKNLKEDKMRRNKVNYYLDIAEVVAERGTCLRRNYGAIIVKNDEIISTGYTGAPRGRKNCIDMGVCLRTKLGIPRGERYEVCRSVHAEANAIISASREKMLGSTLYLVGKEADSGEYIKNANSCSMCKRMIINAGIEKVIIRDDKENYRVVDVASRWVDHDESLEGVFNY